MATQMHDESKVVDDPLWYKDAIIYELHVKSFFDSNGDGVGDLRGVVEKLDYIRDLGATAIWMLPFFPSPLRDDGYDIANYFDVHPSYGTLRDFETLLREAHKRGLRIVMELVLNHTSDQHIWFQKARRAKEGTVVRDFYAWSKTQAKYREARVIFKDFEASNWSWDPIAQSYYWHRFYAHQPDLNYDNPSVQKAVFRIVDFWLGKGVDGLRLDAIPYLFEREKTNCENLPENHQFLRALREHVEARHRNRMLLAEANQWPEDAAAYFGQADECHMAFHFPLMPRIFMAIFLENNYPVMDILEETPKIPASCQWALFLRNHDELTLEMVSDEERDYMYRVYARDPAMRINLGIRRRLAPLLENDRRKIEVMNVLLFSLPGTPVIYYGDEIGMGDNFYLGDRDGVRTPMQWSADRNAGFSRANPQKLYLPVIIDPEYRYEAINVETLEHNRASLLWWMKRLIAVRKRFKAFGRGSLEFVKGDNPKVLAFVRKHEGESILVVANLSRFPQAVTLELERFAGYVPEEALSRSRFPSVDKDGYVLTLGSHDYYWLLLQKEEELAATEVRHVIPEISLKDGWETVLRGRARERLERQILPRYIKGCRWFRSKSKRVRRTKIREDIPLAHDGSHSHLAIVEAHYYDETYESYLFPLAFATGSDAERMLENRPQAVIAKVEGPEGPGVILDAVHDADFRRYLLGLMGRKQRLRGAQGQVVTYPGRHLRKLLKEYVPQQSEVLRGEQSNSSLVYEDRLIFKLFRLVDEGVNLELEMSRFLTEKAHFQNSAPFAGAIEYRTTDQEPVAVGVLHSFTPNQGDAWRYTLDSLGRYFERVLARREELEQVVPTSDALIALAGQEVSPAVAELVGGAYLEMARVLGMRTAELHLALSSDNDDPAFAPEQFSLLYQKSLYQSTRGLARSVFAMLGAAAGSVPEELRDEVQDMLGREGEVLRRFRSISQKRIPGMKIRIHGDYHLGQVLYTGNDFVIIDFEGEPARTLTERRLKRSPIRDVAGMVRSFHYAAATAQASAASEAGGTEAESALVKAGDVWYRYVSASFLKSYLETMGQTPLIPTETEDFDRLLKVLMLEKAIYELGYELNNRPDWLRVPLRAIAELLTA